MKKLFDKGVFIKTLRELFYLNILLVFIGIILVVLSKEMATHNIISGAGLSVLYDISGIAMMLTALLGSFALSATALSFTWNRKKTDFEYSLPVTKGALYASKALAVVTSIAVVIIIIAALGLALSAKYLGRFVFIGDILITMANCFICALLIVGSVFLASSVTGKLLSAGILSLGIITVPLLLPVIKYYSMLRIAGFDIEYEQFILIKRSLYVPINLLVSLLPGINFAGFLPGILFSLVLGAGYLIAGYFLFKKRSGDMTGNHTKSKLVHYVIMALIPFAILNIASISAFDYGLSKIITKSRYIYEMLTYLGASLMMMFAYDVLVHRKLRKKNRIIWLFIPLAAAAFLLNMAVNNFVVNEKEMDISADKVESVNIFPYDEVFSLVFMTEMAPYGYINSSEVDITDKEIISELAEKYNERKDDYAGHYYPIFVKFNLDGGRSIYKFVPLEYEYDYQTDAFIENTLTKIQQLPEYEKEFYDNIPLEKVATISCKEEAFYEEFEDEFKNLYEVFIKEYDLLSTDEKCLVNEGRSFMGASWMLDKEKAITVGNLYVRGRIRGQNVVDTYYITFEYTPDAAIKYMETVNMMNLADAENVVKGIEPDAMTNIRQYGVYFLNSDITVENSMIFVRSNDFDAEYFYKSIDILRKIGFKAPEAGSIILKLQYNDLNVGYFKEVYLSVTEDEMNELISIYNEWQDKRN